ncbi:MAG: hypothetical protein ACI914_000940 [Candidatus Marivariicella framensis]
MYQYELDLCEDGEPIESWQGWPKIISDKGYPNIDWPARSC